MTRSERQSALVVICEAEVRCHGWSPAAVDDLRADVAEWWKADPVACEAYLAAEAANAAHYLERLTRRAA